MIHERGCSVKRRWIESADQADEADQIERKTADRKPCAQSVFVRGPSNALVGDHYENIGHGRTRKNTAFLDHPCAQSVFVRVGFSKQVRRVEGEKEEKVGLMAEKGQNREKQTKQKG
jgi:hypothetical protein